MTYPEFTALLMASARPVILLEGRRSISSSDFRRAHTTARHLAEAFPHALFRSGNADGSDQAFTDGIATVDPSRLQIIAPYQSHRRQYRTPGATYESPDSLNRAQEETIAGHTIQATPRNSRLIDRRADSGPLAAKARYLMRDTMKVTGHSETFPPPTVALFYVSLDDPEAGGTGHTIRVCRQHGVPYAFQNSWDSWFE
ncbi:MAG: hypothetical protein O3A92_14165 [Verrucomicrobia bacterium]|nr:hypothetical protein [Verrucomicrobiota bacterium]